MSLHEYQASRRIVADDPPFYSLVMAAMWKADSGNLWRLKQQFPDVWIELEKRYNAPGGLLEGERL